MTKPQTMLQLSGRSYNPAALTNATVLVIDVQEEYRSGVLALPALNRALPEITRLLAAARRPALRSSMFTTWALAAACSIRRAFVGRSCPKPRPSPASPSWPNDCPMRSPAPSCTNCCRGSAGSI